MVNQRPTPLPEQYTDRLEDFDPDVDWAGIVASKDVYAQKLLKTLQRRTMERDSERAHRLRVESQLDELHKASEERIAELEENLREAQKPVRKSA